MKAGLLIGPLSLLLAMAPLANAQEAASSEARRQGRVAMNPNAVSPPQSMQQAIAFERYKELAAEREARKTSHADRSVDTPRAPKDKK